MDTKTADRTREAVCAASDPVVRRWRAFNRKAPHVLTGKVVTKLIYNIIVLFMFVVFVLRLRSATYEHFLLHQWKIKAVFASTGNRTVAGRGRGGGGD